VLAQRGAEDPCSSVEIELHQKSFSRDDLRALLRGGHERSLTALRFHRCNLATFQDGITELARGLSSCMWLQELTLVHCAICGVGARQLRTALERTSALTRLRLEKNGITPFGLADVCDGLKLACGRLQVLSFAENSVGLAGARQLEGVLAAAPRLQTLNLDGCSITSSGTPWLVQGLESCQDLQHLSLARNPLGCDGVRDVARLLDRCLTDGAGAWGSLGGEQVRGTGGGKGEGYRSLRSLNLEGCGMSSAAAQHLCACLAGSRFLEAINLSGNAIGDAGAAAVKGLLERAPRLATLSLAKCSLTAPGAAALCRGLAQAPRGDVTLILSGNNIGDAGVAALAQVGAGGGSKPLVRVTECNCSLSE